MRPNGAGNAAKGRSTVFTPWYVFGRNQGKNRDLDDKIVELVKRSGGLTNLESKQALERGIDSGKGGVFLKVTPEQYAKLKRKQYFDRIFLRNSRSSGFDLSGEPKKAAQHGSQY